MLGKKAQLARNNNVTVENRTDSSLDLNRIIDAVVFLRERLGVHGEACVDVTLVDEAQMSSLHERHLGDRVPTDVLSFPMDESAAIEAEGAAKKELSADFDQPILGDIVLCPEYIQRTSAPSDLAEHLDMLVTHSMLHLIGLDHPDLVTREIMFKRQDELLATWLDSYRRAT